MAKDKADVPATILTGRHLILSPTSFQYIIKYRVSEGQDG